MERKAMGFAKALNPSYEALHLERHLRHRATRPIITAAPGARPAAPRSRPPLGLGLRNLLRLGRDRPFQIFEAELAYAGLLSLTTITRTCPPDLRRPNRTSSASG